ncbi:MAG: addiction module protein [Proteobacteria bacterium HN_bin10]|jgi:putative addiction module killer protein|nr:MAG: addiction module protein [Proteobacteria bacterium HN_bin10]
MFELVEYLDSDGASPFAAWFNQLDAQSAARVTVALGRLERGNTSSVKGVGTAVMEYRIDTGPGYRIYFARDGERLVILLAGGTKRRQEKDIEAAKARWSDYKKRKRGS